MLWSLIAALSLSACWGGGGPTKSQSSSAAGTPARVLLDGVRASDRSNLDVHVDAVADPPGTSRLPETALATTTGAEGAEIPGGIGALPGSGAVAQWAKKVSPTVEITVAHQVAGAKVALEVTPGAVPEGERTGGKTPAVFVAVYEERLGAWFPLPSTYDPKAGTVTAVAPHFSKFSSWVVDTTTAIGKGAKTLAGYEVEGAKT